MTSSGDTTTLMFIDFWIVPLAVSTEPGVRPTLDPFGTGIFMYAQFEHPNLMGHYQSVGCMTKYSNNNPDGSIAFDQNPSVTNYFGK